MNNVLFSMNVEGVRMDFVQHTERYIIILSKKRSQWVWELSRRPSKGKFNTYKYKKHGYTHGYYIDTYNEPDETDLESILFWETNFKKINLKSINNLI